MGHPKRYEVRELGGGEGGILNTEVEVTNPPKWRICHRTIMDA